MRLRASLIVLSLLAALPAAAQDNVLSTARLVAVLHDPIGDTLDQDRMDHLFWIDSDGQEISDYVAKGGTVNCGDPQEFFGQAYGDVDGTTLVMVGQGTQSTWNKQSNIKGTATGSGLDNCMALSGRTTTVYSLSSAKARENMLKIVRTFRFSKAAKAQTDNLRAYAARLPDSKYQTVLYPDSSGSIHTFNVFTCPTACTVGDWAGTWFADDNGSGQGVMVIRDPASTAPARLKGDFDSFSGSNVTGIVLTKPAAGWKGTVTETEYLCFYDRKSWPAGRQETGQLPKGCTVK